MGQTVFIPDSGKGRLENQQFSARKDRESLIPVLYHLFYCSLPYEGTDTGVHGQLLHWARKISGNNNQGTHVPLPPNNRVLSLGDPESGRGVCTC